MDTVATQSTSLSSPPKIWWSNAIFFVSVHVAAAAGAYYCPPNHVHPASLMLAFLTWQLADFGITVGYHRLYSHRAFKATLPVRIILAVLGSAGFQGSIKWWTLRHRLHHRFTDDTEHDPYAATRGLFYSHMGWIFYKPVYLKMDLIDREDLERDPVVRLQHKYYVPIASLTGFALPVLLGHFWNDRRGAFVWAGLVSRLFIWHSTFLVNSLAHWDGLQPYSDEDTSRGNLILALLTGGEGSHNFHHTFPHDFRSGPSRFAWDPSKWIILALNRLGLVHSLRRARQVDMDNSIKYMDTKSVHGHVQEPVPQWQGAEWTIQDIREELSMSPSRCFVVLGDWVVDATSYLKEHPGGASLIRKYSIKINEPERTKEDATWAFEGGLNNHSRAARWRLEELRVARFVQG
ncbi:hypothetical protein CYLTODRAFT_448812 [Cylindrobasidium torrendii FP15055 ss-10]|uniref:Acyl-CoA desaturase n=1 Tax=Cylindrobasidium torrendii FP15055 ss-10 TaxID=1314674 RepID=A0A0D7BSU3_9AGAR|nr:hypothetical protein CYLTODRAFT_448812 [Cylindrobasidium torrendii FP15055 ss-10]